MQYQQISLSRLSRSGKKLIHDGDWHAFVNDPKQYYRVKGKIVQRIHLNEKENDNHFRLMNSFDPLPSKLFREGFREQITMKQEEDHYLMTDILIRAFDGWENIVNVVRNKNIFLKLKGASALECEMILGKLTYENLFEALLHMKAFMITVAEWNNVESSSGQKSPSGFSVLFNTTIRLVVDSIPVRKNNPQLKLL